MQKWTRARATYKVLSPEVILSSTISDSHTWNLCFLQLVLEEHGYEVRNLGACVPPKLLVERCVVRPPALIVLSSVNGHGYYDGQLAVRALREAPTLDGIPIVIGGKLGIGDADPARSAALLESGFDGVFGDTAEDMAAFGSFLEGIAGRAEPVVGAWA